MRRILSGAIAFVLTLAGCGDYNGPSRGFQGNVDIGMANVTMQGINTTFNLEESPMGYRDGSGAEDMYSTFDGPDGKATGKAAEWLAEAVYLEKLALICAVVSSSSLCD